MGVSICSCGERGVQQAEEGEASPIAPAAAATADGDGITKRAVPDVEDAAVGDGMSSGDTPAMAVVGGVRKAV